MEAEDFRSRFVPGADLRGVTVPPLAEFHEMDLRGADLRGADLRGADLRAVSWWGPDRNMSLAHSNLSTVDFRGAELETPDFYAANLRGANLSGLDLKCPGQFFFTSFSRADLTGADLSGVNVDGGGFDAALLDGANLNGAVLTSCSLRNASLVGASLIGANLHGATLTAADLRGANLTNAVLPSDLSAFAGARFDASTQWREERRAEAVANSVAGPDGTHVINSPARPTPPVQKANSIWTVVAGRVAAVLFGIGVITYGVLIVTGNDPTIGHQDEHTVFERAVAGLILCVAALGPLAGGIFGFPEDSPSSSRRSGGGGFDDGTAGCGCGMDAD